MCIAERANLVKERIIALHDFQTPIFELYQVFRLMLGFKHPEITTQHC